jgi:hypothetical protein
MLYLADLAPANSCAPVGFKEYVWQKPKRTKRKVFGKPVAVDIDTAAVAVPTAGNRTKRLDQNF